MVKFDELRISEDRQRMTVECHVEDYDVYAGMYIQSIYLEYYKNRGTVGVPSDKAILLFENHNDDPTVVKAVRKTITPVSIPPDFGTTSFDGGLFYVYVICDGDLAPEAATMTCGFDNTLDVGVIPDWKMLYERIMPLVAKFADSCTPCDDIPGFGHLILLWYAFKYAIDVCDWVTVDRLWDEFIGGTTGSGSAGGCGCFSH